MALGAASFLRRSEEEGVRRLLGLGWRLLRSGHARDAVDAFGRVLVRRPGQIEAQQGVAQARQDAAEQERVAEAQSVSHGRRRSVTQALSHRNSQRAPQEAQRRRRNSSASGERALGPSRSVGPRKLIWGRRVLLTSSAVAVATALSVVHLHWNALMGELCRPPMPSTPVAAPVLALPLPSVGQRTLMEAHRKIESGDTPAAQHLLQSIAPEDPAYPFAQRMQLDLPRQGEQP